MLRALCFSVGIAAIDAKVFCQEPLVQLETVPITHPANPDDITGYGAVGHEYRIGKHQVSIMAYTTFLNAVAASDPYTLYNPAMGWDTTIAGIQRTGQSGSFFYSVIGDGERPVSYVSWFDAARFCNWLHNGGLKGSDTEDGCYPLHGSSNGIIEKLPGASWWIPTENEWYKAAYYQPADEGGMPTDTGSMARQATTRPARRSEINPTMRIIGPRAWDRNILKIETI